MVQAIASECMDKEYTKVKRARMALKRTNVSDMLNVHNGAPLVKGRLFSYK